MTSDYPRPINEDVSPHCEFNNAIGGWGSGGSMNNPMYRKICGLGNYEPLSGRGKRRMIEKYSYGKCISKKKKFWNL